MTTNTDKDINSILFLTMVRVISDKKFNPPRSRHSSGETVDKELAARTGKVLASLKCRRYELSDCDSFSDSHWDSETDVHNCSADNDGSEHDIRSEKIVRLSNTVSIFCR